MGKSIKRPLVAALAALALALAIFVPAALATVNGFEVSCTSVFTPGQDKVCTSYRVGQLLPTGQTANRWIQGNARGTHSYSLFQWRINLRDVSGAIVWQSTWQGGSGTTYNGANIILPPDGTRGTMEFEVNNLSGQNDNFVNKYVYCVSGTTC